MKTKQNQPQHHIIRIRNMRNALFHQETAQLENDIFENMWAELSMAFVNLGTAQSVIDEYKTREMDPIQAMIHYIQIREQVYIDMEGVYHTELQKKKIFISVLGSLAVLFVAVAIISNCLTYYYARTWSSCVKSMNTYLTGKTLLFPSSLFGKYSDMFHSVFALL